MRVNKAPCGVTHSVSVAKGNITSTDGADSVKGGILRGTKYAWVCQGPFLKIIDVSSGEKIAGWRFGAACSEFVTEVSCAVELPYSDDACNLKQIILGLECEVIGGMICVFDVQGSRLLRAIRIPGKPLSLSIVDSGSSGCEGRYPLPGLLSSMSGIIAVGLQGGSVFLIDLCRLTCDELLNTWFNDDREEIHDEINPCQLLPINKDDDDSDKLEKKCATAAVSGDHLCLLLNESAFVQDNFLLLEPEGKVSTCFKTRNIGVTSLLYVPRIASLVVGYSFGCFQLWNLMHLTLNYTSRMMKDPLPVLHLGFQEPSDDPCNFCYLWAVHSSTDEFPSSSPPVGIMYALSYDSKEWVDGYGYLYQDYQSCQFRFEYNLEVDGSEDLDSISCVSFSTLSNVTPQRTMPEDGYEEVASENDFSLCIFAWEAYDSENKPISTYLSLFDLNQWYKDQMPVRVSDAEDENLGYLVTFSLNCIRQKGDETSQIETPLLDIRVDPQNLSQFKSFQPQEEHFHPSALSFVSHCLLEDKVVSLSHPGLQQYLLLYMEKEGPICLLRPVNLFKHCVMVGLKPVLMDCNGTNDVSPAAQREFLLSVALENQMLGFLHRCASDWANGSVSGVDCSLPMLLSWGFQRAMVLKETADRLCIHLFDHTGIRLDKNECHLLDNCARQLRQLATLFEGILSDCRLLSLLNLEDLRQKTSELNLVALYFEVLLWFLNVGLLPEFPENDFDKEPDFGNTSVDKIPYPATVLTKFYTDRRLEFKNLNSKNGTKASLYVDQLLQNESNGTELANLWINDGGSGMYPPPSIQSLLAMYLQDGIDIQTKNSIVIYVFLDLATLLDPERYSRTIEYFVKFPCAFCMTPSIIKVTQAFWLLDQKHFEDALDMVLDPLVSPKDLQPWQHRFIVHSLLSQGQHSKALEYFTVRQLPIQGIEDLQLKITLLVMNKQVTQAYNFLQQYHDEENDKDVLYHFYQECGKARQLGTVLKLMLSPAEEDLLMNYLQSSSIAQSEDMQVVFYLMRSRVIEAVAVNERIKFSGNRKASFRRTRNDPAVRDVLVGGYAKTLPSVTRQLANYCSQQKKLLSNWRQVQRPTPMSVDVHYGTKQPVPYKPSLIHATLEKARETWMMPVHSSFGSETRSKEMMDISAMQNLPFLCNSHDTLRHDRETTPVVFPSVTSSIKRRLDDDGGAQSTPLKRSRLESSSPLENFLLLSNKKVAHELPTNNSSLLLKSPLVRRITPLKQVNDHSAQEKNVSSPFAESFTPQSILKVRNLVRSSVSPEHANGHAEVLLPREQNTTKYNEERLCVRQIRFSLPVPNDMEEPTLSNSTPTNTVKKVLTPKRVVDASPRLPLRSTLSLLQKPVVHIVEKVSSDEDTGKKSWLQKSPAKEIITEGVFEFGSAKSNIAIDAKSDGEKIQAGDNEYKLNESIGEESFYSATSSSDSGTSIENSRVDFVDDENSASFNHGKYIDDIKEIKPRRQLSRLKSDLQNSVTDNYVHKQKEVFNDVEQDEINETLYAERDIYKKCTTVESEVEQYGLSSEEDNESDGSEDNCDINGITSKQSILEDSYLDYSTNINNETLAANDVSDLTSEESDVSFKNKSQYLEAERSQRNEECSIAKVQQIKARRPLSRIRRSGNFENSPSSMFENSSYFEITKHDILGNTNIVFELEANGSKENINDQGDSLNSDEEVQDLDDSIANDAIGDVEVVREHRANVSASYISAVSKDPVNVLMSSKTKHTVMWNTRANVEENGSLSEVSKSTVQESYSQENSSVFLPKDYECQEANAVKGNVGQEEFVEKDQVKLVSDYGKTYVSLSAVTTDQSSYGHLLPPHHGDVDHAIVEIQSSDSVPECQDSVLVLSSADDKMYSSAMTFTNSVNNVPESCGTLVSGENVCTIDDGIIFDDSKDNKKSQNREAESNPNLMEQDLSSTAGETSGTIDIDADKTEEINNTTMKHQDHLQHIVLKGEMKSSPLGSNDEKGVCKDPILLKENVNVTCANDEFVVDTNSKCNKFAFDEQQNKYEEIGMNLYKKSFEGEECKTQKKNNESCTNPDDFYLNQDSNDSELVLKLSDSDNESESNRSMERMEIQRETREECDQTMELSQSVNFRNQLDSTCGDVIDTVQNTYADKNLEEQTMSNISERNHSVCSEYPQPQLIEGSFLKNTENSQTMEAEAELNSSHVKSSDPSTSLKSETPETPLKELKNVTSANQEMGQSDSCVFGEHYTLRSKQRSRSSSVQSEPPQMSDVSMTNNQRSKEDQNIENSQGHERPRRRRSSLQIEPMMYDKSASENEIGTVPIQDISTSRTRQRRWSSSIQSEPHQITDVAEIEHPNVETSQECSGNVDRPRRRRSSLQIDPLRTSDKFANESRDEAVEAKEMSTPKIRQRQRSSSIQSEPPRMADVNEAEHSGHSSRPRRRRSSLQIEPIQMGSESVSEIKDVIEAVGEICTLRTRRSRPSSVQSEPPQISDVEETEHLNRATRSRRRRNSLQQEQTKQTDMSVTENKESLEISVESSTFRTRSRSQPSSIQDEPSEIEMSFEKEEQIKEHKNKKAFHQKSKSLCDLSLLANMSMPENVFELPLASSHADEPQPSTSSAPQKEDSRMNLRSLRAYSVDRELPKTKAKKESSNSEFFSDSDDCSVQSEPPQLSDVSQIKQLRSSRFKKGVLKKKKGRSTYVLKIPAPKLACVKEEPENESSVGNGEKERQSAISEYEGSPAFVSVRNLRRKRIGSAGSQTSLVDEEQVLQNKQEDDRADSPVSISSSKSTVIIDSSYKRKRCSSPSSPEEQEVKKFQKDEGDIKEKSEEEKDTNSENTLEQYATARRLTRYQKSLMERSMDISKNVPREFHRRPSLVDRSGEDSDGESVASGYTSGSSQVRSSARLQEKRQILMNRSPSQSSRTSVGDQSPLKQSDLISPEKRNDTSPASVRSGKSTSYASSVSSSQWPSPTSAHLQSPLKPRRKSFQNAQKALSSPTIKKSSKASVTTTDTSEAESVGEADERIFETKQSKKDLETTSDTGSVKSQSSDMSSTASRSTRSSVKNTETIETHKSRNPQASHTDLQPQRELRQRKETSYLETTFPGDDLPMSTESLLTSTMSGKTEHLPARESQNKAVKPESRRSVFKKRKFLKIHSKRKTS